MKNTSETLQKTWKLNLHLETGEIINDTRFGSINDIEDYFFGGEDINAGRVVKIVYLEGI